MSDVVRQNQPAVAADTADAQVLHGPVDTREMKPVLDDCWQLACRAVHNVAHNREDRGDTAKDILFIGT